ncbi:signal peptide peptidase SppA [Bacteroidota bacterium]
MNFLRNLLAVLVGLFIFTFFGILIFIGIIAASSSEKPVSIEDNSILRLEISGILVERGSEDPFENLGFPGSGSKKMGLKELKEAIQNAKEDDKIKGIFLQPKFFSAGVAMLSELRAALKDFKESGKFIVSYSEYYSEKGYYLSSLADEIYLIPDYGSIELNGLSVTITFLKGMFDKLEIEPEIFRVGDYKSAVEPFLREDMSPESRKQVTSFLNSIYDVMLEEMADSREIPLEEFRNISDSMLVRNPEDAVQLKIVTGVKYLDEVNQMLKEKLKLEEDDDIEFVTYKRYNRSYSSSGSSRDRVAVIVASGEIVSGKGSNENIGASKFTEEIRKARESDRIKAIVLRINSPGGGTLASDVMWREIQLAKDEKPVIASMSDVAASGGYYLAMGANRIVANPMTITGSIGIYGMMFNLQDLLNNKLGITTDVVNTGEFSDIITVTRSLSEYERSIIQQMADEGYEIFTTKAAEGRGMELEELLKVASGRVWSGTEAKEIGLIDEFGSLEDAIQIAADMADLEEYSVRYYPHQKSVIEQLVEELEQDIGMRIMKAKMGQLYPVYENVQKVSNYNGILTRMPFDIEID